MTRRALVNASVLLDGGFRTGTAVVLEAGRIAELIDVAELPDDLERDDLGGGTLMPGFIDTQVNGGGGVLFNDRPTVEAIATIGAAHRRFGTTGFLPTLISDDLGKVALAMDAVREAIAGGVPGVLGIHLEGPFLNVARKGAHDAGKIREIDEAAIELISRPIGGRTIVTLAPEKVPAAVIARLARSGVIVSAGHSDARAATVFEALDNGLRAFTHLFNAMSSITAREPGMVGAALYDQRAWCGIVVDGRHVDPVVLKIALAATRRERFMLVTDAMPTVGSEDPGFLLQGRPIRVENGVCVDEAGVLSGSNLDMAGAVRNAVDLLGLTLEEAAAMASRNAAHFLGLERELGRIAPRYRADLVLTDERLNVVETWIGGQRSRG
jgi:N-acetylglucosamine-6-phosphate deacetylase